MTQAFEVDLGPLTWVKSEIDLALARAAEALEQAAQTDDAAARLQFAQTHLHQVRGALSIVGLDGLTQYALSLDQFLGALAKGEIPTDTANLDLGRRTLASIGNYLEELAHGTPDQPLRLTPLYTELAAARGLDVPSPAELFFPDLTQRPPRRDAPAVADMQAALRPLRTRFERGLLDWLRTGARGSGAQTMREAAVGIEALQAAPAARALWWASLGLFDALAHSDLTDDTGIKPLLAQLDGQLRRAASGAHAVPDRLLRDILYRVAAAPARTEQQHAVRQVWHLDALMPEPGARVSDIPLAPLLQELKARLATLKDSWDDFSNGSAAALTRFEPQLGELAGAINRLGRPALDRLLHGLRQFTRWLASDPLKSSPAISLELATALLLVESGLERSAPDSGFTAQTTDTLTRLDALMRGKALPNTGITPGMEAARRAQEREALAQLAREILSSLAHVEQTLDDFFRNQERRAPLAQLSGPLRQIEGALTLLGETEAIALVHEAAETIAAFAAADTAPDEAVFATLAHRLSALGFFVESLPHRRRSLQYFLDPEAARAAEAAATAAAESVPTPPAPVAPAPAAVERPAPPPTASPSATPRAEPRGVPPVAEPAFTADPEAIEALEVVSLEEFGDDADTAVPPPAMPEPTAETQKLIQASDEEIDAELLEIFIEEAHDVLATINEHLELSRTDPSDANNLTAIRRGFHTLKGSGRMVGLKELGEAAWGLEQTLNRWLQLEWPPTSALHHLIDAAHQHFSEWVVQLEGGGAHGLPSAALLAQAEQLRNADSPTVEPGAAPPPDAADVEAAAVAAPPFAQIEQIEPEVITLDFPDLALSDSGEILPFAATPDTGLAVDATAAEAASEPPSLAFEELEIPLPSVPEPEPVSTSAAPAPAEDEFFLADETFILDDEVDAPHDNAAGHETDAAAPPAVEAVEPVASIESSPSAPIADYVLVGDVEVSRPLYELYLAEARHHIATLHQEQNRLAANPTLLPPDTALRAAHTLAGISGTSRLMPLHALGRALEHAMERLRDLYRPPSGDDLALFCTVTDTLEGMLAEVANGQMPLPVPEFIEQLEQTGRQPLAVEDEVVADVAELMATELAAVELDGISDSAPLAAATAAAAEADTAGEAPPAVHDDIDAQLLPIFLEEAAELLSELHATLRAWQKEPAEASHASATARLLHTLKGSARMAGAMTLGEHFHQLESRLEPVLKGSGNAPELIDELASGLDLAEQIIDDLATGGSGALPTASAAAAPAAGAPAAAVAIDDGDSDTVISSATLRVRADLIDRFVNEAGEIGIARTRIDGELRTLRRSLLDLTENVIRLRNQLREVEIQADVQLQSRIAQAESHHSDFDPLEMDRYTRLQELTRMMAESVNDVTTVQQNLLKNLDGADLALHSQARLSRELQQALMRVRMVPFDSLADRLYRVVRQGAKDLGKRANLDLRGGRIEVDRSVLEHMVAPLEHLLRNSLAHGIESPADRHAADKPEIGQLGLAVSQEGNEIVIELADDGAGLNFQRIAERARANGLLGADEVADERRLTNLIFVPGFSTAGAVSAVSGRGVGMDVVKEETAAVGGRIEVRSTPGSGTVFRIYLPLTLAVTQALLVHGGGRTWAIPSSMVAQVMELKADALERLRAEGGTDWQGERYTYRYLPRLLGDYHTQPELQRYNWVLLLRAGAQAVALHVDSLRGNQEIVVKNAGPQLTRIVGMSGATVLGDGEIVLILNPVALASRNLGDAASAEAALAVTEQAPEAARVPTVMVVDDSLTVRKITGRLLEREGYRVITAKDGADGLEKLLDTIPDVILSDIEMPRMDGFDFVRNVRADARTHAVPVIMITSRLADKHRRYAEEIGANHYLGKPYQEDELLGLIAGYTGVSTEVEA